MRKANADVRAAMMVNGLRQWEVAEAMNMAEPNFSRKLRKELPEEEKRKILDVVDRIGADAVNG